MNDYTKADGKSYIRILKTKIIQAVLEYNPGDDQARRLALLSEAREGVELLRLFCIAEDRKHLAELLKNKIAFLEEWK